MGTDLTVVLFVNPATGRVALCGVFDDPARAELVARTECPRGSWWDLMPVTLNEALDTDQDARYKSTAGLIAAEDQCPTCRGCGLNEERTAKCDDCRGLGTDWWLFEGGAGRVVPLKGAL
jgi:hypothetical protein